MRVRLTRLARSDLLAISDYLTQPSEAGADSVLRRIAQRYQQLSLFPNRGTPRSDILAGVRMLVVERWLVLYMVGPDVVVILRIVDGSRDLSRLSVPNDDLL
ncbi:MAG: type II toxin-antitoxin system RelE/ParE family toxin [Tardiphaga sp.]|nr:type II toxin-antitoxin system RelE/ParE family toxin [Tardiphaga sp.]